MQDLGSSWASNVARSTVTRPRTPPSIFGQISLY
jgi:hypothetical protein